jgi:light-regulated signal transduction histidine kinase (bacteriophytochrome)
MQTLVQDLLTFSRVGRQGTDCRNTDCNVVLETALQNLRAAISESGAKILCDRLPVVVADGAQLEQVFQNLIGNAIKFRGSDPPAIRITANKKNGDWVFSVADNGIGIDPEHGEIIFAIF